MAGTRQRASDKAAMAARRAKAVSMSLRGHTYEQIAEKSRAENWEPRPYQSRQSVANDVKAALAASQEDMKAEAHVRIERRLAELTEQLRVAWAVVERDHYVVNQGVVVTMHGKPLLDDKPKLEALDRIDKIMSQILKITGDYAPVKKQVEVGGSGDVGTRFDDVLQRLGIGGDQGRGGDVAASGPGPAAPPAAA